MFVVRKAKWQKTIEYEINCIHNYLQHLWWNADDNELQNSLSVPIWPLIYKNVNWSMLFVNCNIFMCTKRFFSKVTRIKKFIRFKNCHDVPLQKKNFLPSWFIRNFLNESLNSRSNGPFHEYSWQVESYRHNYHTVWYPTVKQQVLLLLHYLSKIKINKNLT